MKEVGGMGNGGSFGELALSDKKSNKLRQTTVVALKMTNFVVLHKGSYDVLSI